MLRWEANFQIPDASAQAAVAYVEAVSFVNEGGRCLVHLRIWDEVQSFVLKEYDLELKGSYPDLAAVYAALESHFE